VFNFAVLIPKVSAETDFWRAPLNGIKRAEAAISEYGIKIELYFFDINDRKSFEVQSRLILKNAPAGILLAPSFINEAIQFTTACRERNIPYVLIDSNIPNQEGLCYIGPHLFRSGYLSAQLMNFALHGKSEILVINIAKEVDDHNYLMQIEEGFRAYFKYHNLYHELSKLDITQTDHLPVERELSGYFDKHPGIKAIFVTNSRVSTVARYLENAGKKNILLIGFDFLEENIEYLKKDVIDILICHKPAEQGYKGIMRLYQHFVLGTTFKNISFMPIDIVTKENYEFYDNYLND
jgi:LacI family transcriptional regulator